MRRRNTVLYKGRENEKMGKKNNLHIGNIGGNFSVGGDIVSGDKITITDKSTTIQYGFKREEDKDAFVSNIHELSTIMKHMQSHIETIEGLAENQRKEILDEMTRRMDELKSVKEEADAIPPRQEVPHKKAQTIEGYLDKAGKLMERLQKIGEKATDFANKIVPLASKALPILISIRKLFGLP
ncbi:MAG: hypothetical protein ACMUIL_03430 [bacterium]